MWSRRKWLQNDADLNNTPADVSSDTSLMCPDLPENKQKTNIQIIMKNNTFEIVVSNAVDHINFLQTLHITVSNSYYQRVIRALIDTGSPNIY